MEVSEKKCIFTQKNSEVAVVFINKRGHLSTIGLFSSTPECVMWMKRYSFV